MIKDNISKKAPRVSVVMAIYKEPVEWMRLSIDSILNQTFSDFEFIIINDNPQRQENRNILNEYALKDIRIIVVQNESNIGLTKSLNKGLDIARGEYIARMDADDIACPERLEKQLEFMNNNPTVGAVGCNAYVINDKSLIISKISRPINMDDLRYLSIFESPIYHPASFYRRLILGNAVCYDEKIKYSQDYALWISLLKMSDVANLQDRLIKYRITDSQISSAHHVEQQQFAFENQLRALTNIGIVLGEKDSSLFKSLTRPAASTCSFTHKEVRDFIVRFLNGNKVNLSVGYRVVKNRLILIYANRIAHSLSLPHALCSLLELQILTNTINFYSILSLVNKYRVKLNAK